MSKKKHTKRATKQGTELLLLGLVIGIAIGFSWYFLKDRLPASSNQVKPKHHHKVVQAPDADKKQPKFDFYTMLPDGKTQVVKTEPEPKAVKEAQISTVQQATEPQKTPVAQQTTEAPKTSAPSVVTPPEKTVAQAPSTKTETPIKTPAQSQSAAVSQKTAPTTISSQAKAFIVQVGSFKNLEDAERAKAELTLEGYSVTSQQVSNNSRLFYRVFIGPYPKQQEALQATKALAKLNYHGLILAR